MNQHLKHMLISLAGFIVVVGPMVAANPAFQHFIAQHPSVAVYVPIVVAIYGALDKYVYGKKRMQLAQSQMTASHKKAGS